MKTPGGGERDSNFDGVRARSEQALLRERLGRSQGHTSPTVDGPKTRSIFLLAISPSTSTCSFKRLSWRSGSLTKDPGLIKRRETLHRCLRAKSI